MFVFYEIEYLCLLNSAQQLSSIADDGYKLIVPLLQLEHYGHETNRIIEGCEEKGTVKLIDVEGFEAFLIKNNSIGFGKCFLYLLHTCIVENSVLVIDNKEITQIEFANRVGVETISIDEFTKNVIKNKKYIDFLMSVKDQLIKIKS